MSGETNLARLLQTMEPKLLEEEYVFLSFKSADYGQHPELRPIATFMEQEGLTMVVPKVEAEKAGLAFSSSFCCISLMVHSSLDAVGLTAAFSNKLAEHGISANVMAGFYHDHIFVSTDKAEAAVSALKELSEPQR